MNKKATESTQRFLDRVSESLAAESEAIATRRWPVVDWFIPDDVLEEEPDALRRMRLLVGCIGLALPFVALGIAQLLAAGPEYYGQATGAALALTLLLVTPFLLKATRSVLVPGTLFCLTLIGLQFFLAFTDAGLRDATLFWAPVVPVLAAFIVGPRLALVSAALVLGEIGVLYALEEQGYPFPHLSSEDDLVWFSFLTLGLATGFAALIGWLYEGYTLKRLRLLDARLQGLQHALQESETRYRALFQNIPVGVYKSTPAGEVLLANPALATMLGYDSVVAFAVANMADLYADAEGRRHFQETIAREGVVNQFENRLVRRDGRIIHVLLNARATFGPDGEVLFYEGTVEDVTEHRAAEEALHASEERFRALVQHSTDVITVIDADGTIQYMSPSVERSLGYTAEASVGRPMLDALHPDDRRRARVLFRRVLRRPGEFGSGEFRCRHAAGHYVYVEVVGSNMLDTPQVGGIVLNARDTTERKRAEVALVAAKEQAEEMARMKSAFLANMSHEIRTPLTGILGFSSVLAEEVDEPHREFVYLIERSGRRLLETLNSVLDLARLEADQMEIDVERLDLGAQVEEIVPLLGPLAREKGLALDTAIEAPGVEAYLDTGCLSRILNNLIGNAIKFTQTGGVTVRVTATPTTVAVRVEDTGVGIDEAFLPHLFDEFKQESTGFERSHEGSGLGLTITRRLVELLHGTLDVESVKGEGSTFIASFPRADLSPAPALTPRPDADEERDLGRPRVLALDDNESARLLLSRLLGAEFEADVVGSVEEALQRARSTAYDAVLMDIHLSDRISGLDVMGALRNLPGRRETPVVALTAFALPGDRERFLSEGFDGYLSKPFTRPQLLDTLRRTIRRGRQARRAPDAQAPTSGDGAQGGPGTGKNTGVA